MVGNGLGVSVNTGLAPSMAPIFLVELTSLLRSRLVRLLEVARRVGWVVVMAVVEER